MKINFAEPDYTIVEGSELSCLPIVLQFIKNQEPFTVRISPVTIDRALSLDLDNYLDAVTSQVSSRATTGQLHKLTIDTFALHYYGNVANVK